LEARMGSCSTCAWIRDEGTVDAVLRMCRTPDLNPKPFLALRRLLRIALRCASPAASLTADTHVRPAAAQGANGVCVDALDMLLTCDASHPERRLAPGALFFPWLSITRSGKPTEESIHSIMLDDTFRKAFTAHVELQMPGDDVALYALFDQNSMMRDGTCGCPVPLDSTPRQVRPASASFLCVLALCADAPLHPAHSSESLKMAASR
jgi:hypothetical protein